MSTLTDTLAAGARIAALALDDADARRPGQRASGNANASTSASKDAVATASSSASAGGQAHREPPRDPQRERQRQQDVAERRQRAAADRVRIQAYPPVRFNTVLNIVEPGRAVVHTRLGRMLEMRQGGGYFFAVPLVDTLVEQDLREQTILIEPQNAVTKDNVRVDICGKLFLRVVDPVRATFAVDRVFFAATEQAIAVMRRVAGGYSLDELFKTRSEINAKVSEMIGVIYEGWGLAPPRYEIGDIVPDENVNRAMDRQSIAERERRGAEAEAEAHKKTAILVSEGEKQRRINEADGAAYATTQDATARATATRLAADAQAAALAKIATALQAPSGDEAARIDVAKHYVSALGEFGRKGTTAVFSRDVSNMPAMMAAGLGVLDAHRAPAQAFSDSTCH